MGTTVAKLNKVLQTKEAIRTAINSKGGTLTESDTFSSYSIAIDNIQTGSKNEPIIITENGVYTAPEGTGYSPVSVNVATQGGSLKTLLDATQRADYWFFDYKGTSVSDLISYSDTSNVKYAANMFQNCTNITSIPNLDFSKVVETRYMFHNCEGITNIPDAIFENASSCNYMFSNCVNLEYIKIKLPDNLSTIQYMFSNCEKLNTIDMSSFSPANKQSFASNCYSLKKLIIRSMSTVFTTSLDSNSFRNCYHFYGTTNATYNPEGLKDGTIYVPDDKVEELKTATNWSVFADIIVPLSTLVEE